MTSIKPVDGTPPQASIRPPSTVGYDDMVVEIPDDEPMPQAAPTDAPQPIVVATDAYVEPAPARVVSPSGPHAGSPSDSPETAGDQPILPACIEEAMAAQKLHSHIVELVRERYAAVNGGIYHPTAVRTIQEIAAAAGNAPCARPGSGAEEELACAREDGGRDHGALHFARRQPSRGRT